MAAAVTVSVRDEVKPTPLLKKKKRSETEDDDSDDEGDEGEEEDDAQAQEQERQEWDKYIVEKESMLKRLQKEFKSKKKVTWEVQERSIALGRGVLWQIPTLEDIFLNKRRPPLTKSDFRNYMRSLQCEAYLDFLTEVEIYKLLHRSRTGFSRSGSDVNSSATQLPASAEVELSQMPSAAEQKQLPRDPSADEALHAGHTMFATRLERNIVTHAQHIITLYIADNSVRQLSVSPEERADVVTEFDGVSKRVLAEQAQPFLPQRAYEELLCVFDDIRDIVLSAVRTGPYLLFVDSSVRNISPEEINRRWGTVVFFGCLTFAIGALLLELDASRWWRFIVGPPMYLCFAYAASSVSGVCSGLAGQGRRMAFDPRTLCGMISRSFLPKPMGSCQVQDPALRARIKRVARRNNLRASFAAIFFVIALVFAVPEGASYNFEGAPP